MTAATRNTQDAGAIARVVSTVRSGFGYGRLESFGMVEIMGPDAAQFLQNRLSNDVLALKPGEGHLNAVLDRQAKAQGVFSLHRTEQGFFLIVEKAALENTIAQIEKYHILEQFQTRDVSGDFTLFTVQGPEAASFLAVEELPEHAWMEAERFNVPLRIIKRSLSGENGFTFVIVRGLSDQLWKNLQQEAEKRSGVEIDPDALEVLRIEAGLPLFGVDYDAETLLPETGLEREAVSYSKGCYLGQETVARVKTYGTVPKALAGLILDGELPAGTLPLGLSIDDKIVGNITSFCHSPTLGKTVALAYLGKAERVPGKVLTFVVAEKSIEATVALLPFVDNRKKSGEALLQEGLKLFSEGYDEAATKSLEAAIALQPDLVPAYEALGVILSRHDRYDEAISLMNKVLELDPEHVLAHTNLSVFWMKKGDKEKAEEEKALATTAAFRKKMQESGLSFDPEAERKKREQATLEKIGMFQEALKYSPDDPLGNFGLASAFMELKRYQEAVEPLRKTIKAQPKHSVAYLSLGKAHEALGDREEAQAVFSQGIEVAAAKGDLMPLKEMQARLENLAGGQP